MAYAAFCQQYGDDYYGYALLRLCDAQAACRCVEGALAELVTMWPAVLGSVRPAAVAWEVLRAWTGAVGRATDSGSGVPVAQADAVLLHDELRLSQTAIASVMGLDEAMVTSHLRQAHRMRARAGGDGVRR